MTALLATAALAFGVPTTSTAYCLHGTMADGTYTRVGSIAHNGYPLGTHVTVWPSPTGERRFVVRDRIGWGTQLDFWLDSCSAALAWGRRVVHVSLGWADDRARALHRARRRLRLLARDALRAGAALG